MQTHQCLRVLRRLAWGNNEGPLPSEGKVVKLKRDGRLDLRRDRSARPNKNMVLPNKSCLRKKEGRIRSE